MKLFIKKYSNYWSLIILFLIFFLALALRLWDLGTVPKGLQIDELNAGYQGYKIFKTGSDIFGDFLPFYVNRIGDFRPAGIFYLSGLSAFILGISNFAVRFPAALIGALTIFPVFLLAKVISKNKRISAIAAFLIAISPWHIVASRATSESVVALFLTIFGAYFFLRCIKENNSFLCFFSTIFFLGSYFFYHTPRFFIPIFLFLILIYIKSTFINVSSKKINISKRYLYIIFTVVSLTSIIIFFTPFGTGRLNQISVFQNQDVKNKIHALQDGDRGNIFLARVLHNKIVVTGKTIVDQYLSYYSTEFLFIHGGLPSRYAVDDSGLFYYMEFPLLLAGLYFIIRKKDPLFFIPIFWLIIGPLAASITLEDTPNIQRAILMLPSLQIIEAYGVFYGLQKFKPVIRNIIIFLGLLFIAFNSIYFLQSYFVHISSNAAFARNDGSEELFLFLNKLQDKYDEIYVPSHDDLPLYFFYHNKIVSVKSYGSINDYQKRVQAGKYIFVPEDCPEKILTDYLKHTTKKILFADYPICQPDPTEFKVVTIIHRLDDTQAYILRERISQ